MINSVTWSIDCSLYTIEQLENLAEIVYQMDCSVGNQLYDVINERQENEKKF